MKEIEEVLTEVVDHAVERVETGQSSKIEAAMVIFSYLNVRGNEWSRAKADEAMERIYGTGKATS